MSAIFSSRWRPDPVRKSEDRFMKWIVFLQLNPDSNFNIIYYVFSVGYYSTHGSQRFRRTPFKDCLIWMQCELSKCKFVCIVCDTFALITRAYLENVSFVQEQNRLPLRREINTQTGCMYKSKENMIVCCRKSAFLKIIWRKGGPISDKFLLSFGQKKFVMHRRFRTAGVNLR